MWVITKAYNDYDQHGEYLVTVFDHLPSLSEIMKSLGCSKDVAKWIVEDKGRMGTEDCWYFLTCLDDGEEYVHKNV